MPSRPGVLNFSFRMGAGVSNMAQPLVLLKRPKTDTIFYSGSVFAVCSSTPLLAALSTRTAPTSGTQTSPVPTPQPALYRTPFRSAQQVHKLLPSLTPILPLCWTLTQPYSSFILLLRKCLKSRLWLFQPNYLGSFKNFMNIKPCIDGLKYCSKFHIQDLQPDPSIMN